MTTSFTILIDDFTLADLDIALPEGTTIIEATAKAKALSATHYHSRHAIRLAAEQGNKTTCIWANDIAHARGPQFLK